MKLRILHLLTQTELTGSEAYAQVLTSEQVKNGHEVMVLSDQFHLEFAGKTESFAVSQKPRMGQVSLLAKKIHSFSPDVIHAHSRGACRWGHPLSKKLKIPLVTTLHGYQHFSWSKRLFDRYGDTVISICENVQDQLIHQFKMDPHKIKLIRNPIDFGLFNLKSDTSNTPASGRQFFSIIGRNSGPKGERLRKVFLALAPSLLKKHPEMKIRLVLSGLSADEKGFLDLSVPEAFRARVEVLGSQPSLKEIYLTSRTVLAAGRVVLEAFSHGCEVLCLGESAFLGRLNPTNLAMQLKSNFGDVGENLEIDFVEVENEISLCWKAGDTDAQSHSQILNSMAEEFSLNDVSQKIEECYRSAIFLKRAPKLPILMYHQVPEKEIDSPHKIFVTRKNFARHLVWFKRFGLTPLHFEELWSFWQGDRPWQDFPKRPVIITFDDGYLDNLKNAQPLLKAQGFKATLFLLANPLTENSWDQPKEPQALMTLSQRAELDPKVFEIGSHGLDHSSLTSLSDQESQTQILTSKQQLEREFQKQVLVFAYPYGRQNLKHQKMAREAGYKFAVNTDEGPVRWADDRWALFRIPIFPQESVFSLWKKTRWNYRRYFFKKRGR